ncbi:MAG: ABC transporter permease [Planctomycetes bacterium]|nr:ABC transporter permease [Planctomycetota bacterium]
MIKAVIWKELREQGLIGLTLVVLGSGVLVGVASLAEPPGQGAPAGDVIRNLGLGLLATLMLCVTAGMVCGGAVFAAEREAGTMGFLDSLPVSRWLLWRSKLFAGAGLAVAQVAVLIAVATALGLVPTFGWGRAVGVFALLAFVWGMLGSTLSRTTLGSIGVAIPSAVLATVAVLVMIVFFLAMFTHDPLTLSLRPSAAAAFLVSMFTVPLGLSAWVFTKPDRLRAADDSGDVTTVGQTRGRSRNGVRALVWLTFHQMRGVGAVLSVFAFIFGLMMLAPNAQPFLMWPALALSAGVLCGVTCLADEQTRGVARFWGEQRLPIGRVWVVKVGLHFLMCLGLLFILALPLIVRSQFADRAHMREHSTLAVIFRSPLFDELGRQGWKFLLLPAVYGFTAGHLCGLTFRKLVVACGVAGILGAVGTAAWEPSLLAGGVANWQLWLPPLIGLITARMLIPAWATDRLTAGGPLGRLAGGCLAGVIVLALGIGFRVLEVPDRPDAEADVEYVSSLPPLDANRSGTGFRTAAERHARMVTTLAPEFDRVVPAPPAGTPSTRKLRIEERLNEVPLKGWSASDAEMEAWLDRLFGPDVDPNSETWYTTAATAATYPVGIYESPQLITVSAQREASAASAQRMATSLLVRGLQQQAAGDSEAFIEAFRTVVTLAQTMRNGTIVSAFQTGRVIEEIALHALDRWLEALPPQAIYLRAAMAPFPEFGAVIASGFDRRPDLLRTMIAILEPEDPTQPFDPTPHFLAERYVIREAMKAPAQWLPYIMGLPSNQETTNPEIDIVTLAWTVPWERERTRRLVGLGFETGLPTEYGLIVGRPGAGILIRPRLPAELIEVERNLRSHRRAALLKLALRTYRAEHGKYPDQDRPDPLAVLVEDKYLHRIPPDAYDEARSFGYRVGPLGVASPQPRPRPAGVRPPRAGDNPSVWFVPPGQAMIWCHGPSPSDPARNQSSVPPGPTPTRPDDLIYLVPIGPAP